MPEQLTAETNMDTETYGLIVKIANCDSSVDAEALEAFFHKWNTPFTRYLAVYFSDLSNDEREDIIQITILNVWKKAKFFRGHTNKEAVSWIYRIVHNTAVTAVRAKNHCSPTDWENFVKSCSQSKDNFDNEHADDILKLYPQLNKTEREYLDIISRTTNYEWKDCEVAKIMGYSATWIHNIKIGIRRKLRAIENSRKQSD